MRARYDEKTSRAIFFLSKKRTSNRVRRSRTAATSRLGSLAAMSSTLWGGRRWVVVRVSGQGVPEKREQKYQRVQGAAPSAHALAWKNQQRLFRPANPRARYLPTQTHRSGAPQNSASTASSVLSSSNLCGEGSVVDLFS